MRLGLFALLCIARAAGTTLDVVLSYYQEDPECVRLYMADIARWVPKETEIHFFVYSKGDMHDFVTHTLDNIGREGDVYARHIASQFGRLADHVLFSQACPSFFGPDLPEARLAIESEIRGSFRHASGFVALGPVVPGSCDGDPPVHPMPRVRELHAMTHLYSLCPPAFWVYLSGQFIVSRARIHRNPVAFYKFLIDMLNQPLDHFSMRDVELVTRSYGERERLASYQEGQNTNYFSFQLERSWGIIFDCIRPLNETHNC
jgi:hypothetical protein